MDVKEEHKRPAEWRDVTLGELFTFKNGLNKGKDHFGYGTPIVNYMDVYTRSGIHADDLMGRVSLSREEIKSYNVHKGDVFFTRTSETTDEIGIASVMLDDPIDTVFSGFVLRARPRDDSLDDQFKRYCFSTREVRKAIMSKSSYTTRALTNGRFLSTVTIPLPSIPEQRTIAAALSDVDALIAALDRLIAKKRDIKQAAMQELLTGKRRLHSFEKEEWESTTFGTAFDFLRTANNAREDLTSTDGVGYLHYGDIHTKWQTTLDLDCVDLPKIDESKVAGFPRLQDGDLIIADASEDYDGVGVAVEVGNIHNRNAVAGLHTLLLREKRSTFAPGFKGYIQYMPAVRSQLIKIATGVSVYSISKGNLAEVSIPVPSLEEQCAITVVLSDMDTVIKVLESRRDKISVLKQGMMQELLTGRIRLVQGAEA